VTRRPGERVVDGQTLYSAAWLSDPHLRAVEDEIRECEEYATAVTARQANRPELDHWKVPAQLEANARHLQRLRLLREELTT